jgi:virginiamycin A acetyltransferase
MPLSRHTVRQVVKRTIDGFCRALTAPCAWMCAPDAAAGARNRTLFTFWAQTFALVPGLPGVFLRRAFYRWTLRDCARSFFIGFGAFFSHPACRVEADVYVGPYAIVGSSWLRRGCLVGSRASIVSGAQAHEVNAQGQWMATNEARLREVEIGEYAWLGEAAIVMADVGPGAMVAAGAVVSSPVPSRVLVAGNPARFVKHITPARDQELEVASG